MMNLRYPVCGKEYKIADNYAKSTSYYCPNCDSNNTVKTMEDYYKEHYRINKEEIK